MKKNKKHLFIIFLLILPAIMFSANYKIEDIVPAVKMLAKNHNVPDDVLNNLIIDLNTALKNDKFIETVKEKPVKGILVFKAGEGGFIVKYMKGSGKIHLINDKQSGEIQVESWSGGAQIGGSSVWGVGLILGLEDIKKFSGDYKGKVSKATAAKSTSSNWIILKPKGKKKENLPHLLYLMYFGRGMSANAGGMKMRILPLW